MARKDRHPRPKPDLDEPLSLHPFDPEEVLRQIVQEPDKAPGDPEEPMKP